MGDGGVLEEEAREDLEWEAAADRDDDSALGMEGEGICACGVWEVEFDGPWHFLESGTPSSGNTLLKRRNMEMWKLSRHRPYWDWSGTRAGGQARGSSI